MTISTFKSQSLFLTFCILFPALLTGCSQPILESGECIAARDPVKRFYSYHFGNEMTPSPENLEKRKDFLSKELESKLREQVSSKEDYFTQTDDYPKAFRAGKCETVSNGRTKFEILLFWRTNEKNIQREIEVEAIEESNKWVVDKVTPQK